IREWSQSPGPAIACQADVSLPKPSTLAAYSLLKNWPSSSERRLAESSILDSVPQVSVPEVVDELLVRKECVENLFEGRQGCQKCPPLPGVEFQEHVVDK